MKCSLKQRSTLSIVVLILESAARGGGATKAQIMRDVMLSYPRASRYCGMLLKRELLHCDSGKRIYRTTAKGTDILQSCNELAQCLPPISKMIEKYRIHSSA